jgi:hypothetical protein
MEYIEIGGEKRPVKYGWNALATFGKLSKNGADFSIFDKGIPFEDVLILIYAGLKEGARKEGKEFGARVEDVGDWLDEDTDKIEEFMKVFTDQMPRSKKVQAPEGAG